MTTLVERRDWAATPLGPVDRWPQSLRTAVSVCLASRFPMLVWWGRHLVKIYNDAYLPILGDKHPRALGSPGARVWPEIWDTIGPMLAGVLAGGPATWSEDQLLLLERHGFPEECYFTFSYSPIQDESGGVGGVFTAVSETTGRVVGERRLSTLGELAAQTADAKNDDEVLTRAAEVLARARADLPFALVYLVDDGAPAARLVAGHGLVRGGPAAPVVHGLGGSASGTRRDGPWPFGEVCDTRGAMLVADLAGLAVDPAPADAPAGADAAPERALVLPLMQPGRGRPVGMLVAAVSARLPLDEEYRSFLDLVAGHLSTALGEARAYAAERARAEALAELDRSKTTFLSNVSHEFRTPLTLLLGPAHDALAEEDRPAQRVRWELVERSGTRLLKLVNTLLDFARVEAGRAQAHTEPVELATYTAELAGVFRSAFATAGLRFVVDPWPLPRPVWVDREMWEKIVLNLLSNALKYTLTGEVRVSVRAAGELAELVVADTGAGIPADEMPRLFDRFHRVRDARSRSYEGSGIGLALVKELVELHEGTIAVDSVPGSGTTVTVSLPFGAPVAPTDEPAPPAAGAQVPELRRAAPYVTEAMRWLAPTTGATSTDWPVEPAPAAGTGCDDLTGARILIADDNADMRGYLVRLLGPAYQVKAVPDGAAALASIRAAPPELVLADVMMPGLDGFELLRALRDDPATARIPVVLLSARAGEESAIEGLSAGADDYLVKPFPARELLARVQANLRMSRLREAATNSARQHAAQLSGLAAAAVKINSAGALDDVLELVTDQARKLVGTHQAVTSMTVDDGGAQTINQVSLSDKYAAWRGYTARPEGTGIHALVCAENRPMRLTQAELTAHPAFRGFSAQSGVHPPLRGWLAVPLRASDGRNLGVIQLSDRCHGEFDEADEAVLVQLAELAAARVEAVRLYDREAEQRRRAERVARLQGLLAEASRLLAARLEPQAVLDVIGKLAVPALADCVVVHLAEERAGEQPAHRGRQAPVRLAHVRHRDDTSPGRDTLLDLAAQVPVDLDQPHGAGAVIRTGRPEHLTEITDELLVRAVPDADQLARLRELDLCGLSSVPLTARGRTFGALSLVRTSGAAFGEEERRFAEELAQHTALAYDNARLFQSERRLALTLQRSLLPQELPIVPGLGLASRYLAGARGTEVGGDFWDVLSLPDGRVAVAVGDVMGRGVTAAAAMGQLRSALRGYALEGQPPAALLGKLDTFVQILGAGQLTTCLYGVYDPATGQLSLASAGHLPPLLLTPAGQPEFLSLDPGLPLGVAAADGDVPFVERSVTVPPGSLLLLYTDGLVEGRGMPVETGMAKLREALLPGWSSVEEVVDRALHALGRDDDHDDDTALLAVAIHATDNPPPAPAPPRGGGTPHPAEPPVALHLPSDVRAPAGARRFVEETLAGWRLDTLVEDCTLMVSELVTNAVRYGRGGVTVHTSSAPGLLHVGIDDPNPTLPAMRHVRADDEGGWGLWLVDALADRWGAEQLKCGKRVWFEVAA